MLAYKPIRQNIESRNRLRESCNAILEQLSILDELPAGRLRDANGNDVAICREVNQIMKVAERY